MKRINLPIQPACLSFFLSFFLSSQLLVHLFKAISIRMYIGDPDRFAKLSAWLLYVARGNLVSWRWRRELYLFTIVGSGCHFNLQCDACVCVTFVLSMNRSTSNLCFNEFNGYSTLMFEGSLDLYDKEWKRMTETLCRIVVSCTKGYWWHEDEWEFFFNHIPLSELGAFAMWICVTFVLFMMKLPYNSRTWHLGESWNSAPNSLHGCCHLQAIFWHGRSSPCEIVVFWVIYLSNTPFQSRLEHRSISSSCSSSNPIPTSSGILQGFQLSIALC